MPVRKNSHGISPTATAIEDFIREHKLTPGDVLPSEAALCELLNVSRSSVREAMRTLSTLDVVEVRHGYGTYVGQMSLAPLINGMVLRMSLNEKVALQQLKHVVDTRIAFDLAAAEDLMAHYRATSTATLRQHVADMRAAWDKGQSFAEHDRAFHQELIDQQSNPLLRELTMAMWEVHTRAIPIIGVTTPKDMEDTINAHELMIDALEAGDMQAYKDVIEQHYRPLRRVISEQLAAEGCEQ